MEQNYTTKRHNYGTVPVLLRLMTQDQECDIDIVKYRVTTNTCSILISIYLWLSLMTQVTNY